MPVSGVVAWLPLEVSGLVMPPLSLVPVLAPPGLVALPLGPPLSPVPLGLLVLGVALVSTVPEGLVCSSVPLGVDSMVPPALLVFVIVPLLGVDISLEGGVVSEVPPFSDLEEQPVAAKPRMAATAVIAINLFIISLFMVWLNLPAGGKRLKGAFTQKDAK